jgi:DnaJ-class molecular chaperone
MSDSVVRFGASPFDSPAQELCPDCDGTGVDPHDAQQPTCLTCGGWGWCPTDDGRDGFDDDDRG